MAQTRTLPACHRARKIARSPKKPRGSEPCFLAFPKDVDVHTYSYISKSDHHEQILEMLYDISRHLHADHDEERRIYSSDGGDINLVKPTWRQDEL